MQQHSILYMDAHAQKGLSRALARHGKVFPVAGINDALFLMAEQDIDYYFIDADVPDARAFLMHIQHDPQLLPPRGLVLLTENEEEVGLDISEHGERALA